MLEVAAGGLRKLGAGGRLRAVLPAVTVDLHVEPAELHYHVGAARQLVDLCLPVGKHFVRFAGVGADADRSAEMVEHDRRIGERSRMRESVGELGVGTPHLEAELAGREMLETGAEVVVGEQALGWVGAMVLDVGTGVPECPAADAAKPTAACGDVRIEHIPCCVADAQINGADDAGSNARLAVVARCAHGGDAVDELGLADAAEGFGPLRLEHGTAFDEYSRDDVVAAVDVLEDFLKQVALLHGSLATIPEVMMRVTDWKIGLERRFLNLRQPGLVPRLGRHNILPLTRWAWRA